MTYCETKNYAKFRRSLKTLCPLMGEAEMYKNWWIHQCQSDGEFKWNLQQTPIRGVGDTYHYVYITTTNDDRVYVGVHSPWNLDDGYHGSGDEIRKLLPTGAELKTTVLEFFRTREEALAMERHIVNPVFLAEPDVMNKVPGGDDTRHDTPDETPTPATGTVTVDMPLGGEVNVPVMDKTHPEVVAKPAPKKMAAPSKQGGKKSTWFPFSRLGIPVGEKLTYIGDESIVATTLNDVDGVGINGSTGKLNYMTNKIAGKKIPNCLAFWKWRGKTLLEIKNDIIKKGG